ncbi:MAG: hypothetical protein ACFFAN_17255 [Promethearchaeota archaeon]
MSFNLKTAKELLSTYSKELDYVDGIRTTLESKANTQMEITGIILGLYGTMSTIFLISAEALTTSTQSLFISLYVFTAVTTVILMFCALIFSILTIRVKEWLRPIFYQKLSEESAEEKSKTIETAMEECNKNEEQLITDMLKKTAFSLTVYLENNARMANYIKYGYYFILLGLVSFIFSIIILIITGGIINI